MDRMKTGFKVFDAMTKRPVIVPKETLISECAKLMSKEDIGSLVIGSRKRLEGIITEQDIVRKVIPEDINPYTTPVAKIMVQQIFTVSPEIDLYDAIKLMCDYNIKHLPVIARKHVIGYLTLKDILRIQPQLCGMVVDIFSIKEVNDKPIYVQERGKDRTVCPTCGNIAEMTVDEKSNI